MMAMYSDCRNGVASLEHKLLNILVLGLPSSPVLGRRLFNLVGVPSLIKLTWTTGLMNISPEGGP